MNPLLVPELLYCVLDCLAIFSDNHTDVEERRTLAALARTCSAFTEPCLDRLWRRLDSLLPFIQSFSDDVDETRAKTPPSHEEWCIINRYSFRVQELTLGTELLSLHFLRSSKLALPNLKVLKWRRRSGDVIRDREKAHLSHLWPLLTPETMSLEMILTDPSNLEFQSFLERYPLLYPRLKSIKFGFSSEAGRPLVRITQALSRAVCSRTDWERVELSCAVDNVTLRHLGLCPTLKVVSLTLISENTQPGNACFGHAEIPFCNVTRLALTLWSRLDAVIHLLRPDKQAFRTIDVILEHTAQTTARILSELLAAIVSPRRIQSLQSLVVRHPLHALFDVFVHESSRDWAPYDTFLPIVHLVHLRELVIALNNQIALDDDEFASLVRNWPCLEVLCLTGRCEGYGYPNKAISLRGLLSLLESCPELRKINLSVDARQVPSADVDICRPGVTSITFHDSYIDHPELVEAFLLKHLPSVDWVNAVFTPIGRASLHRKHRLLWRQLNTRINLRHEGAPL